MAAGTYSVNDTIWKDNSFGVVKSVDTVSNIATVHYYSRTEPRLLSVRHLVASGKGEGLMKGKQIYFDENNAVKSMKVYTLVHDERKGIVRNRIASEIYLYPDGKTQETVELTYEMVKNVEKKSYVRKCYYPDGALQYEENMNGTDMTTVYYTPKGKVTKRPKEKFAPYMEDPDFPGGTTALMEFLHRNVKYPAVAEKNHIEGRVVVRFTVAKDGTIEDVKVLRSGGDPSLDKEAVRVIKSMPRWIPGKQRGEPVRLQYTVPVNFRLPK